MLQVETTPDSSFYFVAAETSAAAHDKHYSASNSNSSTNSSATTLHPIGPSHAMSTSNQWQPPAWHHHHTRHMPAPSSSAAHLPAPYASHAARSANSSPIPGDHGAPHGHGHDDQRYGASYSSNGGEYGHAAYAHESYQQRDHYYASESQWSYAGEQPHHHHQQQQQPHHQHHHASQSQNGNGAVYGGKPTSDSMGLAIDPLPLRHLVQPATVQGINNSNGTVEEELYEAHMLQEALTTPHYTRAHLGGFHHQHQHPAHLQQQHQQQHGHHQGGQPPHYSSPFVSAVLDASAPMHHHHSSGPSHGSLHLTRQSSSVATTSEHTTPSDTENGSGDLKSSAAGKRKRRGESAPRLCRVDGCSKGIRSRGLCKAHGGGRRCMTPGCTTSDQGGGHCVLHGGGRRCTVENCTKSAQWKGLCKMHGGARRCRYQNCTKNGQVKAGYCRAHHNLITKQREQGIVEA